MKNNLASRNDLKYIHGLIIASLRIQLLALYVKKQNLKDSLLTERNKDNVILDTGFRNWKKPLHQACKCH